MNSQFLDLVNQISKGQEIETYALIPFLISSNMQEKIDVNMNIGLAYINSKRYKKALIFVERAFNFSNYSVDIFEIYHKILIELKDSARLRESYKRIGIKLAKSDNVYEAIRLFNKWQYTDIELSSADKYFYDEEILHAMDDMSKKYRFLRTNSKPSKLIKIAYLVCGASSGESSLMKISLQLAKEHDRGKFDILFFTLSSPEDSVISYQKQFKKLGSALETFEPDQDPIFLLANKIHAFDADILVTSAALAEFEEYFISLLRPSRFNLALIHGPPAQFVSNRFDCAICPTFHPAIDSPVKTFFVKVGYDFPNIKFNNNFSKSNLGILPDSLVIISCGRYPKFQNKEFWTNTIEILIDNPNLHFVCIGPTKEQIRFLDEKLFTQAINQIHILGWMPNYLDVLNMADIVVDTYPSGGGFTNIDAAFLGKAVVSFKNDFSNSFSQENWSTSTELFYGSELVIERDDWIQYKLILSKLITDKKYRLKMGLETKKFISENVTSSRKMVEKIEQMYSFFLNADDLGDKP